MRGKKLTNQSVVVILQQLPSVVTDAQSLDAIPSRGHGVDTLFDGAHVLDGEAGDDDVDQVVDLILGGGEVAGQLGVTLDHVILDLGQRQDGGNDGVPGVLSHSQFGRLDGAQADGDRDIACAFLTNGVSALILEGLALHEGQSGAQVETSIVGVVTGSLLPQFGVGSVSDNGHLLAVEVEGDVRAVSVGLDPRNFARLFSRETGMTPSEYKKSQNQ